MTDKKVQRIDGAELRRLAEDQLRENIGTAPPPGTGEDSLKLLHELQVLQIELEMQIVELVQARAEREKIETQLGRYNDLYDFAPVGYFNLDHKGIIRTVNFTGTGFLGVERSLLIGRHLDLFISDETRPVFYDFLEKVFAGETKETCEVEFLKEKNSLLIVQVEAVVSESREVCRAAVIDITERKQAEEYLRQANLIVENSPVVLFRCKATPEWPVELVSRNVIQFGYTPEEFLSGVTTFYSIIHPQDLGRVICEMQEYIASGDEQLLQEYRIVTKGGDIRWIIDQTKSERNKAGDITHYQGIIFDVTERKRAEEALKESESQLKQQKMLLEELNSTLEKRVQEEATKNREKDIVLIQQNRMAALGSGVYHRIYADDRTAAKI
jgi:PAS domain S-box-containing protein